MDGCQKQVLGKGDGTWREKTSALIVAGGSEMLRRGHVAVPATSLPRHWLARLYATRIQEWTRATPGGHPGSTVVAAAVGSRSTRGTRAPYRQLRSWSFWRPRYTRAGRHWRIWPSQRWGLRCWSLTAERPLQGLRKTVKPVRPIRHPQGKSGPGGNADASVVGIGRGALEGSTRGARLRRSARDSSSSRQLSRSSPRTAL